MEKEKKSALITAENESLDNLAEKTESVEIAITTETTEEKKE